MTKTQKVRKPLSPNALKAIIISVICVVMVAVLVVSLVLVLNHTETPSVTTPSNSGSSTLYIKNGDFAYFEASETYPKTAENWTLYTFQEGGSKTSHGFDKITNDNDVVAGIVNVGTDANSDAWQAVLADLAKKEITNVAYPQGIDEDNLDRNVYMFATRPDKAVSASIMSTSFNIPSQTSAKIVVYLNTYQLAANSTASIVVQKYSSTPSALESDRYAYTLEIPKGEDKFVPYEFYIFNRETTSRSVLISVGIGNCYGVANEESYDNVTASGVLFVDDISYETVSANVYREFIANNYDPASLPTNSKVLGEDKEIAASEYTELRTVNNTAPSFYFLQKANEGDADAYLDIAYVTNDGGEKEHYSPFTLNDHFFVQYVTHDGTIPASSTPSRWAMKLDRWNGNPIVVQQQDKAQDHLHISFWVRVIQNNVTAQANIVVQTLQAGGNADLDSDWEDLNGGSFTSVVTSQNITEDNNCGWTKYDIYLKPTSKAYTVRVLFALGNINGYSNTSKYVPNGTLFVTTPLVENVTSEKYTSASGGNYCKKVNLIGSTASTGVSNGSFSSITTSNPDQPTTWMPVFAGYNVLYKDGKGNLVAGLLDDPTKDLDVTREAVAGSGALKNIDPSSPVDGIIFAPANDDSEQNILRIKNNVATSYGYLSPDITLASKTAYAFSALVWTDGTAKPYIYIVKNGDRDTDNVILAKIEDNAAASNLADDSSFAWFASIEEGNGWTRYYLVVVTGDESETVRIALFNGGINGNVDPTVRQAGTVCYDNVTMNTLGTYSVDTKEYEDDDKDKPATDRDRITFTANGGYTVFDKLTSEELTAANAFDNVNVSSPDFDKIVADALEAAKQTSEETPTESTTKNPVNVGLLMSVISSVALLAALMIVVVVKLFKRRNNG